MKKIRIILVIVLSLFFSACHDTFLYRDEFPELHIIAIESVIGTRGYEMNQILALDEDEYGRKLFAYLGTAIYDIQNSTTEDPNHLAILISQKTDNKYAYYYDSINYKVVTTDDDIYPLSDEFVYSYFSQDMVNELKTDNDWDKPIDDTKLFRVEIVKKKICPFKFIDLRPFEDLLNGRMFEHYFQCYSSDRNGLSLNAILTEDENKVDHTYLILLDKNGNLATKTSVVEITDHLLDSDFVRNFKLINGWDPVWK